MRKGRSKSGSQDACQVGLAMDRRFRKRFAAYLRQRIHRAMSALENLDFSSWLDLWHVHPDWKSRGNRYPETREMVAQATYALLRRAEELAAPRGDSLQVFAMICSDIGSSAVYLHSANPNGTAFPHEFVGLEWGVVPDELRNFVDASTHELGMMVQADGVDILIRRKPCG